MITSSSGQQWNQQWLKRAGFAAIALVGTIAIYRLVPLLDVTDSSMGNALPDGSKVLLIRSLTWFPPQRGELVILRFPPRLLEHLRTSPKYRARFGNSVPARTLLKRVVGLPGEREIWKGKAIRLGPQEYWLEGDNKEKSIDSRNPIFGPVPQEVLLGRAFVLFRTGGKERG